MNLRQLKVAMAIMAQGKPAPDTPVTRAEREELFSRAINHFVKLFPGESPEFNEDDAVYIDRLVRKGKNSARVLAELGLKYHEKKISLCCQLKQYEDVVGSCSDDLTVGHLTPKSKGGPLKDNTQLECMKHNRERQDSSTEEYVKRKRLEKKFK